MLYLNSGGADTRQDFYELVGLVSDIFVIAPQQSLKPMGSVDIHQSMTSIEQRIIESCNGQYSEGFTDISAQPLYHLPEETGLD